MGCKCPCGKEYGFDPIGYWVCPGCRTMNDSGPLGGRKDDVLDPDMVDGLVRDATEFSSHADASVRVHPDSWEAWYSLGATYASRGNVLQAGYIWTKASYLIGVSESLERFVNRCASTMADCIIRVSVTGGKCNIPYTYGLEYACVHRLDGKVSFCGSVYDRLTEGRSEAVPRDAFALRNLTSMVMLQRICLLPDIRDHIPLLRRIVDDARAYGESLPKTINPLKRAIARRSAEYTDQLSEPYRLALSAAEAAVASSDGDRIAELARIQSDDGTAGFVQRLSDAVARGADLSYLRATKGSKEDISAAESAMRADVDAYVGMFMDGDATRIPENAVYRG